MVGAGLAPPLEAALAFALRLVSGVVPLVERPNPVVADPFDGAGACCVGCGGLGGVLVAAGAGALASSSAAKGCELFCWLVADACCRWVAASERVVLASDAMLGVLGTAALLETTLRLMSACNLRASAARNENGVNSMC